MDLFGPSMTTLEHALDIRAAKQRVVASNLANIDTPGYIAQRIDFDAAMRNAEATGSVNPMVEESSAPGHSLDGNNVNLEGELSELSRNKLMYNVTAQIMASKLRQVAMIAEQEQ